MWKPIHSLIILVSIAAVCVACGDDGSAPPAGADDVPSTPQDVADVGPGPEDTEPAGGDTSAPADSSGDGPEVGADADEAACAHPCLNEHGKNDKKLCPDPKSDWTCIEGCCVQVFKCAVDADCAVAGFDEGQCTDEALACRCDTDSGACYSWYCAARSQCGDDDVCSAGACIPAPSEADLVLRIVTRSAVVTPDVTTTILVEAFAPGSEDAITSPSNVVWTSSDPDAVSIVDGIATGGSAQGIALVTAELGDANASVEIHNVVPEPDTTLTIVALEDDNLDPVGGTYALVDSTSGTLLEADVIPQNGIIQTSVETTSGVDVHILGESADWSTFLGATGGVLYLPATRTLWGLIVMDKEAEVVVEETELVGANVLRGAVDFSLYAKDGELDLTLSSFPFASGLFDFNLQTILGANVKRFFHPDAAIPGVSSEDTAEIPGGLTFAIAGPAVPDFVLAAPRGSHRVWTLGGRIRLDEVAEYADDIFSAFGGDGINFGLLVQALVPLFADFYTTLTPTPTFAGDGQPVIEEIAPKLDVPMGLLTSLPIPELPAMGDAGFADALFAIAGAVTPDGLFTPLGLNAGSDTADSDLWPPDGIVDADPSTPEVDPLPLAFAPLHSNLAGPHTRYGVAVVAASLGGASSDPRPEGGSAIVVRGAPGAALDASLALPPFLGFPMASTWDAATRSLTVEPVAGADIQRVLFKGEKGENWNIWLNGADTYVVPEIASLLPPDALATPLDRAENTELVLVSSFDIRAEIEASSLFAPGGETLRTLVSSVDRASFVDIE